MADAAALKRVAFSPGEFAALFGKSQTWGYRQIYAGKVKAITEHGRILIPAAEVEVILQTAGIYNGLKQKAAKMTKAEIQKLTPVSSDAWRSFLNARRQANQSTISSASAHARKWPSSPAGHQDAMARLTRRKQ